jgi:DNA repair exonuclease SbcCD ATPase subunit
LLAGLHLLPNAERPFPSRSESADILNEFAVRERQRAERLEARLNAALKKLDLDEEEVVRMRHEIAENRLQLLALPPLHQQVQSLTRQVGELERLVESQNQELAQKGRQIQDLQQTLLDRRAAHPETAPHADE